MAVVGVSMYRVEQKHHKTVFTTRGCIDQYHLILTSIIPPKQNLQLYVSDN